MIRTSWPSRSAPHHWIACQIDGRRDDLRALFTGAGRTSGRQSQARDRRKEPSLARYDPQPDPVALGRWRVGVDPGDDGLVEECRVGRVGVPAVEEGI